MPQTSDLLEHNGQEVLVLSIEDGGEDVQEQAILVAARNITQLGTLVARGGGIDSAEPLGGDRDRGSETQVADGSLGVTDTLETETHGITGTSDTTEAGLDGDLPRGVDVRTERGEETQARAAGLDGGLAIFHDQGITAGEVVRVTGTGVDPELGNVRGDLGQHLLDGGQGAALTRVEELSELSAGGGTADGKALLSEVDEGEVGATDLKIIVDQDLDTVEDSGGRVGSETRAGSSGGGVGVGDDGRVHVGLGGDQDLGKDSLERGCCHEAREGERFHGKKGSWRKKGRGG